jgi:hypothetical protein
VQKRRKKKGEGKLHRRRASIGWQCPSGRAPKGDGACAKVRGVQSVSRCERDGLETTPGFYTNREGRRGNREGAATDTLAIDGRRRCGIKKEGKRGNRRIWRRNGRGDYGS